MAGAFAVATAFAYIVWRRRTQRLAQEKAKNKLAQQQRALAPSQLSVDQLGRAVLPQIRRLGTEIPMPLAPPVSPVPKERKKRAVARPCPVARPCDPQLPFWPDLAATDGRGTSRGGYYLPPARMPAPSGKAAIPTSGRIERQLAHNGAGWAFTDCLPAMGAAPAAPSKRLPSPCDSARPSVPALPLATPNTRPNSTIRERSVTPQLGDLTGGTVLASPTSQFAKEQLFWPSPRDWIKPPKGFVSSPRDAAKLDGPVRQGPPSSRRTRKDSSAQGGRVRI